MDDSVIIEKYLHRDEGAIRDSKHCYGNQLRAIVRNLGLSKEDAEEIENDTYYAAWKKIPPHEPRGYLFRFLAKIAREKAIDYARKKDQVEKHVTFVELSKELENILPTTSEAEARVAEKELSGMISEYLRTETPERRQIFMRRYWFFDSVKDIAKRFGISEGKVKTDLFRVRNGLKEYLEKEGITI